jgi:radical SAM superfamily enzyme YgiQ (UPF0313 family)
VKRPEILNIVRQAGIKWLCLGIESSNKNIRLEVSKGKFEDVDIKEIVKQIENCNINVMANYIYGLPGDTKESIEETFKVSQDLNTLGWNTYAAMALPGSQLYSEALKNNTKIPKNYSEFSFLSFDTQPLPTASLTAAQVLKLRDQKFNEYFSSEKFLNKIEKKFGKIAIDNIINMLKIKLERKIFNSK